MQRRASWLRMRAACVSIHPTRLSPWKRAQVSGRQSHSEGADNPPNYASIINGLAQSSGAEVFGSDTSWVDDGPNFGSRHVTWIRKVKIAMAWDRPTAAGSAGAARFVH